MTFPRGPMEGERSFSRRNTKTTNSPTSSATVTQTTTRADCANQPMRFSSHCAKPRGSSGGGSESDVCTHFNVRMVFSGARLGSAFTASTACLMSLRVGACATAVSGTAAINSAARSALSLERTTQFLLDIPRFQLRAPVQIHRKACSHIERLEEQHDERIGAGD